MVEFYFRHGESGLPIGLRMNTFDDVKLSFAGDGRELMETSYREILHAATQSPHERLHLHAGFSSVKDGTITLPDYRALLIRLYGFYLPFERAVGVDPIRTQWLERDLTSLGVDAATFSRIRLCADLPRYDCPERRLGALYVVEGSALGGRQLCRGLDRLLGTESLEGRHFFAGRGSHTGDAWFGFLERLASVGPEPTRRAALVSAAVATFEVFETWLSGWRDIK
jgi:heme oxygenase